MQCIIFLDNDKLLMAHTPSLRAKLRDLVHLRTLKKQYSFLVGNHHENCSPRNVSCAAYSACVDASCDLSADDCVLAGGNRPLSRRTNQGGNMSSGTQKGW